MRTRWRSRFFPRWARRPVRRWRGGPFGRLVRHFLDKLVRGGQDPASSELELGAGAVIGALAAPGAFTSLLMLDKYSAFLNWMRGRLSDDLYVTSIPDKYLFVSIAMAIAGIVTVLKWDQVLPDGQDYLNFAPLPVSPWRILLANSVAILAAVTVVAVAVNAVPTFLFPIFVMSAARSTLTAAAQFALAHAACVLLASIFSIASVFAILGTFSAVLPRHAFRLWSPWLRGLLLLALIGLLLTGFAGATLVKSLHRSPDSWIGWLPSLWFLGLYQEAQHRTTPVLASIAPRAWAALGVAITLVLISYALSYRRRYAAVLESDVRRSRQRASRAILLFLDGFAPRRAGFGRGAHSFIVRALLRSETHRLTIAVALGLACMSALQDASGAALGSAYLLLLGLRIAFELPAGVPANWIFRVTLDAQQSATAAVARRVMLSFLTPLVLLPCFVAGWRSSGPVAAIAHASYVLALSVVVMELLVDGYRKVPLTCPMPGFRDNFLMLCLILFVGFEFFTRAGDNLERWMWDQPWRFVLLPLAMAAAWQWNRRRLAEAREAGELEEGITFENSVARVVTRLDLSA